MKLPELYSAILQNVNTLFRPSYISKCKNKLKIRENLNFSENEEGNENENAIFSCMCTC